MAAAAVPTPRQVLRSNVLVLLVVALLTTHAALAWAARPPGILTAQDDVEYIVLGQSLRDGSYRERFRIDSAVHAQYPPGYPAMLSVWGRPFEDSHDGLVALSVVLSMATLLLTFGTARRLLGAVPAAFALAILAVNPAMIEMAGGIRSEAAYALLSLASLYVLLRAREARSAGAADTGWLVAATLLALAAVFTRTIGVTLLAAIGVVWFLERRFKAAGVLGAIAVAPLGLWLLWTARSAERFVGSSYIAELGIFLSGGATRPPLPARALGNTLDYATRAVPFHLGLPALPGTSIDNIVLLLILAAAMAAGFVSLRKRWTSALVYLAVYAAVLATWLWSIDRFVLPIIPLLVIVLCAGAWHPSRARFRLARAAPIALALLLLGGGLQRTLPLAAERLRCDRSGPMPDPRCVSPEQADYLNAIAWIGDETPDRAVLLAAKPGAIYWYTGRKSISFPASLAQDTLAFLDYVREQGATHVVLGDVDRDQEPRLARRIAASCEDLRVEARFARATVFSIVQEGTESSLHCDEVLRAIDAVMGRAAM